MFANEGRKLKGPKSPQLFHNQLDERIFGWPMKHEQEKEGTSNIYDKVHVFEYSETNQRPFSSPAFGFVGGVDK